MKWEVLKENNKVILKVRHYSTDKEWCARIVGEDSTYRFKREFMRPYDRDWSSSGRTGYTMYDVSSDGVYEFKNPYDDRYFIKIEGSHWETLLEGEVLEYLKSRKEA
jgi:hypothetical protein